jgi:hypothetical protein
LSISQHFVKEISKHLNKSMSALQVLFVLQSGIWRVNQAGGAIKASDTHIPLAPAAG